MSMLTNDDYLPRTLVIQSRRKDNDEVYGTPTRFGFTGRDTKGKLNKTKQPFVDLPKYEEWGCNTEILFEGYTEDLPKQYQQLYTF